MQDTDQIFDVLRDIEAFAKSTGQTHIAAKAQAARATARNEIAVAQRAHIRLDLLLRDAVAGTPAPVNGTVRS